ADHVAVVALLGRVELIIAAGAQRHRIEGCFGGGQVERPGRHGAEVAARGNVPGAVADQRVGEQSTAAVDDQSGELTAKCKGRVAGEIAAGSDVRDLRRTCLADEDVAAGVLHQIDGTRQAEGKAGVGAEVAAGGDIDDPTVGLRRDEDAIVGELHHVPRPGRTAGNRRGTAEGYAPA